MLSSVLEKLPLPALPPRELYTPLFAIARIVGWSAHRIEELVTTDKIIRPAYKSLVTKREYVDRLHRD